MYAAATAGVGVGCISLEMRATQLLRRLAVRHSGLDPHKFRDPRRMSAEEFRQTEQALFDLGELPITITDQSGLRPGQIAAQARQMHQRGAGIIFVDFVQIIHEEGKDRREAINRVSASLRDTCKSLNVPFVVASQLARRDADENRRPTMQDLRESGKPLVLADDSPAALTAQTTVAVACALSPGRLSRSEREHVQRYREWNSVGDTKAPLVRRSAP